MSPVGVTSRHKDMPTKPAAELTASVPSVPLTSGMTVTDCTDEVTPTVQNTPTGQRLRRPSTETRNSTNYRRSSEATATDKRKGAAETDAVRRPSDDRKSARLLRQATPHASFEAGVRGSQFNGKLPKRRGDTRTKGVACLSNRRNVVYMSDKQTDDCEYLGRQFPGVPPPTPFHG